MNWKEYVRLVLGALLPVAYTLLKQKNPDFPLAQDKFVELILYLIGGAVGGWQLLRFKIKLQMSEASSKTEVLKKLKLVK